MTRRDGFFLVWLAAALAAVLAPLWLHPGSLPGGYGDLPAYHYPLRHLALSRLEAGALPFWNPYILSGVPLLANPQAALFYPLSVIFHCLPLPFAFSLHAALHLLLAGLGAQLLARREGLGAWASGFMGCAYALSPFLLYRLPQGIPTHLPALAWAPWCWLALRAGKPLLLALCFSFQVLGGHPQFALVNALGLGACALAKPRVLGRVFLAGGFLAAALCALPIVLGAQFLAQSNRVDWPEPFRAAYSMPWRALGTFWHPGLFGTPLDGGFAGPVSEFFELYPLYAGALPLLLALGALGLAALRACRGRGERGEWGPWALAALGFFLALGGNNPLWPALSRLPILGALRIPARFNFLVAAGVWLAAASALRAGSGKLGPAARALALLWLSLDLGAWGARFVHAESTESLNPNETLVLGLGGVPVRFATAPEIDRPNKAMLYRAMNAAGYEAFYLRGYPGYLRRSEGAAAADASRVYIRRFDSEPMRRLGVAYYLSPELHRRGRPLGGGLFLYENPAALPLAYFARGDEARRSPGLRFLQRAPERWTLRGEGSPGESLALAVAAYPGWRAWLDGKPVPVRERDGFLQEIPLPGPGPFRVDFLYRPRGWGLLCAGMAAAWAALFALALGRFLRFAPGMFGAGRAA